MGNGKWKLRCAASQLTPLPFAVSYFPPFPACVVNVIRP
jgi:hypothetical protein